MSRAMGIADADLADLARHETSDRFSPLEKRVLDLAVAMTMTPAEVPDELRAALLEHLTEGQLMEVVSAIAWENHRARVNKALGVRPAGFSDGAFCVVPEHRR